MIMNILKDTKMPTAQSVAGEIINFFNTQARTISPLALQKLCYFCHAWHLADNRGPLITDEAFEAWRLGPVIPTLYQKYKYFSSQAIPAAFGAVDEEIPQDQRNFIHEILGAYEDISPSDLVNISHEPGGPWAQVYDEDRNHIIIPNDCIQEYFRQIGIDDGVINE